jgi:tetratricopeptide (TPR) repeat protein
MRREAIMYLAISLAEEDWDGDGVPDAEGLFPRALRYLPGANPYEAEILLTLGDRLYMNTRYADAVLVYRFLLARFPTDPGNPGRHGKIIRALERMQRQDEAMMERLVLSRAYEKGTAWYEENKGNREAIAAAERMAEEALLAVALGNHKKAQALMAQSRFSDGSRAKDEARPFYEAAVAGYEEFLRRYPGSGWTNDVLFYEADCLRFSHRFDEAARLFARVRDASPGGALREGAEHGMALALQQRTTPDEAAVLPAPTSGSEEPGVEARRIVEMRSAVRGHDAAVRACYELQTLTDPILDGEVVVEMTIGETGRVTSSRMDRLSSPNAGTVSAGRQQDVGENRSVRRPAEFVFHAARPPLCYPPRSKRDPRR